MVDKGKQHAYLFVVSTAFVAASVVVIVADVPRASQILLLGLAVVGVVVMVGLLTRRLPLRWADVLVFGSLATVTMSPLIAWHFNLDTIRTDLGLLIVVLWASLLFPIAFVAFGTRRGGVVSVATLVVLAAVSTPVMLSGPSRTRSPLLVSLAPQVAFMFVTLIVLLWLLSSRLERLMHTQARTELLADQVSTDTLTGIANRRRLTDELDRLIANARRHGRPLSVVFIDIDRFKRVNDTYGHDVGDEVLIELARRLEGAVREGDLVGRWGGEEFLAIAPESDLVQAEQVAQRCWERVRGTDFATAGAVTASFGVAALSDGDDRWTLLRRADTALYTAKSQGRDRVVAIDDAHGASTPAPADQPSEAIRPARA